MHLLKYGWLKAHGEQLAQVGCSHLIFVDLQLVPCFEGHL
jgi:hypothetical protein